jgi:hypothetical protein
MINEYVNKLIDDLEPIYKTDKPIVIDLVLEGGVFNGGYLAGALLFIREMERKNYIRVNRISGCSVGSILALFYLIDELEFSCELYNDIYKKFKQQHTLDLVKDLKVLLQDKIPKDKNICDIVNNRLFITYHNIEKKTKPVKCVYKDLNDIVDVIIRSSFVPLLVDGNILYKDKYIDGILPFVFMDNVVVTKNVDASNNQDMNSNEDNNHDNHKILYLNICGYDRFSHIFNAKNEPNNFHRILTGALDIHHFYIKQQNNNMCSYIDKFNIKHRLSFNVKLIFELFMVTYINIIVYVKSIVPGYCYDTFAYKFLYKIATDFCIMYIDAYCV